ncbi:MAG TPA: DUF58 domain-containing protein, partial [Tepidisphaeraceae bacterium]|nr:DUF58 domain-containing protein [Tepidisphaeraceae bacterium]
MIPNEITDNLQYIELFTRKKIRNVFVGNYTSALKGHGYDFVDHTKYQPGDDIRRIDWNATARANHVLIKNTHEEKDLDIFIVADLSKSMDLGTQARSKKELLVYITAAIAYSALSSGMRIGFIGFTNELEMDIEAKNGRPHLWTILNALWDHQPRQRRTAVHPALEVLRQRLTRMSIVFLISDFFFEDNLFQDVGFKYIISRHDLIPVLLYDPLESNLPAGRGYIRVRDLETGKQDWIRLSTKNRFTYQQFQRDRHRELLSRFYEFNLDFQEIQT